MDGSGQYNPRTVEEVFRDFKGRRAGLIKALTTDVEEFYQRCDPGFGVYREIMKRARDFKKQFKLQKSAAMAPQQPKRAADKQVPCKNQSATQSHVEAKRKPVMDCIRVPVSYEDIIDDVDRAAK